MGIEIERKFLVRSNAWRASVGKSTKLIQFYIAEGPSRGARVRIAGAKACLTLKFAGNAQYRHEFEYDIPLDDAVAMRPFALGTVIAKERFDVSDGGHLFEVDVFEGVLSGLVMAELEHPDAFTVTALPDWIGLEVTEDPRYYNASLSRNGLPEPTR